MSKSVESSRESGAHHFKDKGHLKSEKYCGAHDQGKHGKPAKVEGLHQTANLLCTSSPTLNIQGDCTRPPANLQIASCWEANYGRAMAIKNLNSNQRGRGLHQVAPLRHLIA